MKKLLAGSLAFVISLGLLASGGLALANQLFDLDFDDPADASDWSVDRRDTEVWETATFDGDERLHINIDETGDTSGFYSYQGRKYLDDGEHWYAEKPTVFEYKFYIDPSWETDQAGQETGMWAVLGNENGGITAYSVFEYQDSDADEDGEAGFRLYKQDGKWYDVSMPGSVKPEKGGWVKVKAVLVRTNAGPNGEAELEWFVNNAKVAEDDSINIYGETTQFLEPIMNSGNFGVDQDYYYDDISLETRDNPSRGNKGSKGPKR